MQDGVVVLPRAPRQPSSYHKTVPFVLSVIRMQLALIHRWPALQAAIVGIPVWVVGFLWLFRGWVFDSGDGIWGDQGDARQLIAFLEHWYRWFTGVETDWRSPIFFFPERNTLGYSDAYF